MRWMHERVRARLPRVVEGTLPAWRRRLLERHLAGCEPCAAELERQRAVAEGLRELADTDAGPQHEPPEELLESILERVHDPGLRQRAAGPARGAVSGARPELSIAAIVLSALIVYLVWRAASAIADRIERPER